LVILGALAASGKWYAFWVATALSLCTLGMTAVLVVRRARRGQGATPPRALSASELLRGFATKWWIFAGVATGFAIAAFLPASRNQPAWELPVFAVGVFIITGVVIRLAVRWVQKYEEEFGRFTGRGSRSFRSQDSHE
jgi:hypothetical protein